MLSIFGRLTSSGKSSFLIQEYSVLRSNILGHLFPTDVNGQGLSFFISKRNQSELVQVLVAAVMWVVCFQVNIRFDLSSKDHGSFVEVKEKKKKKKPFVPWFLQHPPLIPPLGLNYEIFWMCPGLQFWVSLGCFFSQRYIPKSRHDSITTYYLVMEALREFVEISSTYCKKSQLLRYYTSFTGVRLTANSFWYRTKLS